MPAASFPIHVPLQHEIAIYDGIGFSAMSSRLFVSNDAGEDRLPFLYSFSQSNAQIVLTAPSLPHVQAFVTGITISAIGSSVPVSAPVVVQLTGVSGPDGSIQMNFAVGPVASNEVMERIISFPQPVPAFYNPLTDTYSQIQLVFPSLGSGSSGGQTDSLQGYYVYSPPYTYPYAPLAAFFPDKADTAAGDALIPADTGQVWTSYAQPNSNANAALRILGGKLTNVVTNGPTAAGHIWTGIGKKVSCIGGSFSFTGGAFSATDLGSVTFAAWDSAVPFLYPRATTCVHLSIYRGGFIFGIFQKGTFVELMRGVFKNGLAGDGTTYSAHAFISGDTATLLLPMPAIVAANGPYFGPVKVSDPRIARLPGSFVDFEVYQPNPATDSKGAFTSIYAE